MKKLLKLLTLNVSNDFKRMVEKTNNIWNGEGYYKYQFNSIYIIGPMMTICRFIRPKSLEEFVIRYFEDPCHPHLTVDGLFKHATKFAQVTGLSYEEALKQVLYRMFTQTYVGYLCEEDFKKTINKHINDKYVCNCASDEEDAKFAVDLTIKEKENGNSVYSIQLKPLSYLKGHGKALNKQKKLNEKKNNRFLSVAKTEVGYVYYNYQIGDGNIDENEYLWLDSKLDNFLKN